MNFKEGSTPRGQKNFSRKPLEDFLSKQRMSTRATPRSDSDVARRGSVWELSEGQGAVVHAQQYIFGTHKTLCRYAPISSRRL